MENAILILASFFKIKSVWKTEMSIYKCYQKELNLILSPFTFGIVSWLDSDMPCLLAYSP